MDFLEVCRRALEGPAVSEQKYDLHILFANLKRLKEEYQIEYDPENPVPADDALADRVFQAAIDFICESGIFCTSTGRLIEFSRSEVEEAVRHAPREAFLGEGKEAGVFKTRRPDENTRPWFHVGTGILASSEEIALSLVEGYGNILQANSISIPALDRIGGLQIMSGTPLEIYGSIRTIEIGREGLKRAGRPGLPIVNLISTAGTTLSTIAASNPCFGLRPTDAWLVDFIAEMKVGYDAFNKVAYVLNHGGNIVATSAPLLGGYCGGPEGTAILATAYIIAGVLVFKSNLHLSLPLQLNYSCSTTRNVVWATALSTQAISRNMIYPVIWLGYMMAGPATKMYCYETTANMVSLVASGAAGVQTAHPARAILADHVTPLELKFSVEVAEAATKLNRVQANRIADQMLKKYEAELRNAPQGKTYQECYDLKTGLPKQFYLDFHQKMKEELCGEGIDFS